MAESREHQVFLALGGNLGEPQSAFRNACRQLTETHSCRLVRASSLYRTPPVGGPAGQPDYLNAVIEIATRCSAQQLLAVCQQLEALAGRTRQIRWAARPLDIDLLFVDNLVMETEVLTLPHPRLQQRHFVLLPLVEIAPKLRHPKLGCSVSELLQQLPAAEGITRLTVDWITDD